MSSHMLELIKCHKTALVILSLQRFELTLQTPNNEIFIHVGVFYCQNPFNLFSVFFYVYAKELKSTLRSPQMDYYITSDHFSLILLPFNVLLSIDPVKGRWFVWILMLAK